MKSFCVCGNTSPLGEILFPRWVWDFVRVVGGEVVADVRGWRFDVVGSRFFARPSISDVSSPCPVKRDVWLRRVARVRVDGGVLYLGRVVHEVFLYPFKHYSESLWDLVRGFERLVNSFESSVKRYRDSLYRLFRKALALALYSSEEAIPISVEPMIPAASIGLSDYVKPDLLVGFIPVDIALAPSNERGFERKEVALAGYALAIDFQSFLIVSTSTCPNPDALDVPVPKTSIVVNTFSKSPSNSYALLYCSWYALLR